MTSDEFSERIRNVYNAHVGSIMMMTFYKRKRENPDKEILLEREELYKWISLSEELKNSLPCSFEDYQSHIVDQMLSEERNLIECVGDKYGLTSFGEEYLEEAHKLITMPPG